MAFALVALPRGMYDRLRYPIVVALMTVVIGTPFLPEIERPVHQLTSCNYDSMWRISSE